MSLETDRARVWRGNFDLRLNDQCNTVFRAYGLGIQCFLSYWLILLVFLCRPEDRAKLRVGVRLEGCVPLYHLCYVPPSAFG